MYTHWRRLAGKGVLFEEFYLLLRLEPERVDAGESVVGGEGEGQTRHGGWDLGGTGGQAPVAGGGGDWSRSRRRVRGVLGEGREPHGGGDGAGQVGRVGRLGVGQEAGKGVAEGGEGRAEPGFKTETGTEAAELVVVEAEAGGLHLLLTTPLGSTVLEPNLNKHVVT